MLLLYGLGNYSEKYSTRMSLQLLVQEHQNPLLFLSGVSSVSTRDAEGPVNYAKGIFIISEEVDGGDEDSGNTIMVNPEKLLEAFLEDLGTWDYFPPLLKY
jgi:hypothetical protein